METSLNPSSRGKRERSTEPQGVESESDTNSSESSSSSSSSGNSSSSQEVAKSVGIIESTKGSLVELEPAIKPEEGVVSVKVESESSSESTSDSDGEDSEPSDLSCEEEVDVEVDAGPGALRDLIIKPPPAPADSSYRGNWTGAPVVGSRGFNAFATKVMRVGGVASRPLDAHLDTSAACPPLQPHQDVVAFLLHTQSPVTRLLVDHPTGSGKTREMISVLNNFFSDPRPKVPIFPKEPVCRNFYMELLRWPSSYRDFFACMRPQDAARAAGQRDWRLRRAHIWNVSELPDEELAFFCDNMREVLELRGWFYMGKMRRSRKEDFHRRFPNEKIMAAPLRALRYTSAGGRHTELKNGVPMSALLKVAFDHEGKNVYSNKIVIMDEVHNLVRTQTQYGVQLARLRELLFTAKAVVLAGFTGTPILSEAHEGQQLLEIIKGQQYSKTGDQGFLSSFPMRPQPLFPRSLPRGVPDSILTPKIRKKLLLHSQLTGESLKRYDIKRAKGLPRHRLQRYCNMSVHFGSLHDGKNSCKKKVLADFQMYAPKLHAIAAAVASSTQKSLVLVAKNSGMIALLIHLRRIAEQSRPRFSVATMDEIAAFNSANNRYGEQYRVLVADALTCSEGVSFFAVREVHLADVPATPSAFVQAVGRSVRMYGHRGLPPEQQTVTTCLHVANFPRWMRSSLGAWVLRAQRKKGEPGEIEKKAKQMLLQLQKAGIKDLDALKSRIDACASSHASKHYGDVLKKHEIKKEADETDNVKQDTPIKVEVKKEEDQDDESKVEYEDTPAKDPLKTEQIALALERLGMWEEARAIRLRLHRHTKSKHVEKKRYSKNRASESTSFRPLATPARASAAHGRAKRGSSSSTLDRASEVKSDEMTLAELARHVKKEQKPSIEKMLLSNPASIDARAQKIGPSLDQYWKGDPLASAIQLLYLSPSVHEAIQTMGLNHLSADEEALHELTERSRKFVPALSELRNKAVDRALLRQYGEEVGDISSEGESSELEYAISGSDQEGSARPESNFILPPGWRTEKFRRKSRQVREYVDPEGRRYRTMSEAWQAVNHARARENMTERMRAKYAATLSGSGGNAK